MHNPFKTLGIVKDRQGLKAPIEDYCGVPHYVLYCGPEVVDRVPVPYKSFESLVKGTDDVQDQR